MRCLLIPAFVASMALTGCAVYGTSSYGGTLTATTVAPDLVYVGPGVQVIADYDEPVFYADRHYWRFDGGRWYRSSWYTGGWVYASPPRAVLSIERPHTYRYYRPAGYVSRRGPRDHRARPAYREPVYREPAPVVRDHRAPRPVVREPAYQPPAPVVRDHRAPRPVAREAPAPRAPAPVVRDHRGAAPAAPARSEPAPPAPVVRDHRR
jgi:hypothetical protein